MKLSNRKTLVAALMLFTTLGANAQSDRFGGWSVGVNANMAVSGSTLTEAGVDYKYADNSTNGSLVGSYGIPFGDGYAGVMTLGGSYSMGKTTVGSGAILATQLEGSVKNEYRLFTEIGSMVSPTSLVYGKLAYASGDLTLDATGTVTGSASERFNGMTYGVGWRTALTKQLHLTIEGAYTAYGAKSYTISGVAYNVKPEYNMGSIGLGYKF